MSASPLRSMTGFGEAERDLEIGRLRVEIRTVNHRYLNIQFRTPPGFDRYQRALERAVKGHFARGHANVSVLLDRSTVPATARVEVDRDRARAYVEALRALQEELGLEGRVEVGVLPWFRDLFQLPDGDDPSPPLSESEVVEVVDEAAAQVAQMRAGEGARIAEDLSGRLAAMEAEVAGVERRAPERLIAERDRLRAAVEELLEGQAPVDEERISREIAHLAERWDIHEEVVRFRSHLAMFRETVARGDPGGIGKRLGFIVQELLREANTMGAKANDVEIAGRVIALKEEIERLREQVENVE